jgi:hypothetical protein
MPESTVAQHLVDYEPVLGLGGGPGLRRAVAALWYADRKAATAAQAGRPLVWPPSKIPRESDTGRRSASTFRLTHATSLPFHNDLGADKVCRPV